MHAPPKPCDCITVSSFSFATKGLSQKRTACHCRKFPTYLRPTYLPSLVLRFFRIRPSHVFFSTKKRRFFVLHHHLPGQPQKFDRSIEHTWRTEECPRAAFSLGTVKRRGGAHGWRPGTEPRPCKAASALPGHQYGHIVRKDREVTPATPPHERGRCCGAPDRFLRPPVRPPASFAWAVWRPSPSRHNAVVSAA